MLVLALSVRSYLEPQANPHRPLLRPSRLAERVHDRRAEQGLPQSFAVLPWVVLGLGELRVVDCRLSTPGTRAVDRRQHLVLALRAIARRLGKAELDLEIGEVGHQAPPAADIDDPRLPISVVTRPFYEARKLVHVAKLHLHAGRALYGTHKQGSLM